MKNSAIFGILLFISIITFATIYDCNKDKSVGVVMVKADCTPSEFKGKFPEVVSKYHLEKLFQKPYSEVSQSDRWNQKFIHYWFPAQKSDFTKSDAVNYKLTHPLDAVEAINGTFIIASNTPPNKRLFRVMEETK